MCCHAHHLLSCLAQLGCLTVVERCDVLSTMTYFAIAHRYLDLCVQAIQITAIKSIATKAYEGVAKSNA